MIADYAETSVSFIHGTRIFNPKNENPKNENNNHNNDDNNNIQDGVQE